MRPARRFSPTAYLRYAGVQRDDFHPIGRDQSAPGCHWNLQRDGIHRLASDSRNRYPYGAGRAAGERLEDDSRERCRADRGGNRHRSLRQLRPDKIPRQPDLGCVSHRSMDVRRSGNNDFAFWPCRVSAASALGRKSRSPRRPPVWIVEKDRCFFESHCRSRKMTRWLVRLFRKKQTEKQLDAELRFHLDQQVVGYVAAGMSPEEARRRARLEFGGLERVKEEVRDARWETQLENFVRDFRYALRNLRNDRRLALTAILTLALGIGSTTMIFSVIDCVLLHPFPYKSVDRLASISVLAGDQQRAWRFPVTAFVDFKEQNHTFDDMFGLVFSNVRYAGADGTDEFFGGWVTPDAFAFLGIKPLLG